MLRARPLLGAHNPAVCTVSLLAPCPDVFAVEGVVQEPSLLSY